MGNEGSGSPSSHLPTATMLHYSSLDEAMSAQQAFEARSLIGEMWSELGQYGLHGAQDASDVATLLRAGAPIDGVRRIDDYDDALQHWETPLLTACVDQRFAVAEALLRFGANVDAPSAIRYPDGRGFGHAALHMVVVRRDHASATRLIAAGADVDLQTTMGITPLWYAASNDDAKMVELLLRAGARPDISELGGTLPEDKCGPKTRGLLQAAMSSRRPTSGGTTELMHWAAAGDEARVRTLLDQGAEVDEVDDDGDGALRYALTSRSTRVLELLLGNGADPDAASTSASGHAGFAVLHAMVEAGWDEGAQALIRHGADVDPRGEGGITPMMLAAGAGRDSCIRLLSRAGAEIDEVDDDGDSVLFYAASNGRVATVELLLDLGADADAAPGASGESPLSSAAHLASPVGRVRAAEVPASHYTRIVLDLLRAGADATAMYEAGYVLARQTPRGLEVASLAQLARLGEDDKDWDVIYATDAGRHMHKDLPQPSRTRQSSVDTTSSSHRPRTRATVEIVGSTQTGFLNYPAVKVYWNDKEIGRVPHGGTFDFEIEADGEVRLKYSFRSARVAVKVSDPTKIYLGWDRTWGRLIASRNPNDVPRW